MHPFFNGFYMETYLTIFFIFFVILYLGICILDFWYTKNPSSPSSTFKYKLVIGEGPQKGREYDLPDYIVIGREYKNGISLTDKKVSFKHVMLVRQGDGYALFDLGSSNKTYVNQQQVESVSLRHGDQIQVGETTLIFLLSGPVQQLPKPGTKGPSRRLPAAAPEPVIVSSIKESGTVNVIDDIKSEILGRCATTPDTVLDKTFVGDNIETVRQKFHLMCQISHMVGIGLSLDKLLKETVHALGELFTKIERGAIFLTDPETKHMAPVISYNFSTHSEGHISVSSTILSQAIKEGMAIMCSNAMTDSRFEGGQSIVSQRIKLAMCTPLVAQDEILGAIYLDSTMETGKFKQDDLALLAAVGSQIAIFIKNAQLHNSLVQAEKLQQELAIAQEIQRSFLPSSFPEIDGIKFAASHQSARYVGGDFYDIVKLPDGRIGLVVGDVSGKGVGAALYMASLVSEFRMLAGMDLGPEEIFKLLNEKMTARGTRGMFVTMAYLILDLKREEIIYVNGGHLAPVVLKDGYFDSYLPEAGFPPLGIVKSTRYSAMTLPLEMGKTIILYTDGITEAKNAEREDFGFSRLEKLLREYPACEIAVKSDKWRETQRVPTKASGDTDASQEEANDPDSAEVDVFVPSNQMTPEQTIEYVSCQVKNFCGATRQHDDFTMVVAKFE